MSTGIALETTLRRSERGRRSDVLGFGLLFLVVILAAVGPLFTPYDPVKADATAVLLPPGGDHWLGTNSYGGDVFSRLVAAARLDLYIGFTSVAIAFAGHTAFSVARLLASPCGAVHAHRRYEREPHARDPRARRYLLRVVAHLENVAPRGP